MVTDAIDLNELLPALRKYRELYWRKRADELESYLFDFDLKARVAAGELTYEQADEIVDARHAEWDAAMDVYAAESMAQLELLQLLRGESPEEVTKLQDEVLEKYGEG